MNRDDAIALTLAHIEQAGLSTTVWKPVINTRMRRLLGRCDYGRGMIELSAVYVDHNDECEVEQTIVHEVAHAVAGPGTGHGRAWRQAALRLGHDPDTLGAINYTATVPMPWLLRCGSCWRVIRKGFRRTDVSRRWCSKCGKDEGQGMLRWERNNT